MGGQACARRPPIVDAADATMAFDEPGVDEIAQRAVFVVDRDGELAYTWRSDDPGVEPDYDVVVDAARNAA